MMTQQVPLIQRLVIIETPVRGVIEEQYGHILWTTLICRNMKVPLDILLLGRGARLGIARPRLVPTLSLASNLEVKCADPVELIQFLIAAGSRIFAETTELSADNALIEGVQSVDRHQVVDLIAQARRTWFW